MHGWLVPAGSVEELTNALREVLDTPVETLMHMGREDENACFSDTTPIAKHGFWRH